MDTQDQPAAARHQGLKLTSMFAYAVAAFGADQALKHWVVTHMELHINSIPLIPGWLVLTYTQNFGSAWSMLWKQTHLLIAIATTVALGIIIYAWRLKDRTWLQMAGLGFLLGGALGNLADRARLGYVVDMFDLQYGGRNVFPIFNVADIAIDVGVALLLLFTFLAGRQERKDAERAEAQLLPQGGDRR